MTEIERILDPWQLRPWPRPAQPCSVAFVFSRCLGNWEHDPPRNEGLLWLAADLHRSGLVEAVCIPGTGADRPPATTTYAGSRVWTQALESLGVPASDIVQVPGGGTHTRSEGDDFVHFAKSRGWDQAAVLMHPHETLRVMLGLLRSFQLAGHPLRAIPVTPSVVDWNRVVHGSQGILSMPRALHIAEELRRVILYRAKGDLASLEELGRYYRDVLGVEWPWPVDRSEGEC